MSSKHLPYMLYELRSLTQRDPPCRPPICWRTPIPLFCYQISMVLRYSRSALAAMLHIYLSSYTR
jgi:hypothetical protein